MRGVALPVARANPAGDQPENWRATNPKAGRTLFLSWTSTVACPRSLVCRALYGMLGVSLQLFALCVCGPLLFFFLRLCPLALSRLPCLSRPHRPRVVSLGTLNLALFISHSSTALAACPCYSHPSGAFTLRQFHTVVSAHGCDGDHLLCCVSRVCTLHHFVGCVAISETLPS